MNMSLFPPIEPYNDLFIKVSGHSMREPGIAEKLVQITEYFADL